MVSFSSAFQLIQSARRAAQDVQSMPLSQLLLDLQGQLLHMQVELLEQQVTMQDLASDANRVRATLSMQRRLERSLESYFLTEGREGVRGPYCVTCWHTRDALQLLIDAADETGYCPTCQTTVRWRLPNQSAQRAAVPTP